MIYQAIPNEITAISGENISLRNFSPQPESLTVSTGYNDTFPKYSKSSVKLCGFIPIKTVNVKTIPAETVIPAGNIMGFTLYTKGVAVVSTDTLTEHGKTYSPALKSGIKPGDIILKANGNEIENVSELMDEIDKEDIVLTVLHQGKTREHTLSPVYDETHNDYKLGLWVRDSLAGLGTLTFYNPETKKFGALGHGLTDIDTGTVYSASGGKINTATVISVNKGKKGIPGELCGIINQADTVGTLTHNAHTGVTGTLSTTSFLTNEKCVLSARSEVAPGKAHIISCISGNGPQKFEVEIERICGSGETSTKDMVLHITDKTLLELTGGIVQGMSGSPIIQNGKLIGAVTHVFVNDPTRGYGIFIDKMME